MSLQPLPVEITSQIRRILDGIKSGELEHIQKTFHCGTSHCIAGWHTVFRAKELGLTYDLENGYYFGDDYIWEDWVGAKEDWQLTESEATILLENFATLGIQTALLEYLESGKRVEDVPHHHWEYEHKTFKLVYYYRNVEKGSYYSYAPHPFLEYLAARQAVKQH